MRALRVCRGFFLVAFLIWASLYMPVYYSVAQTKNALPMIAPLSACQIPLNPAFGGITFGYVVYALFVLSVLLCVLLSLFQKFERGFFCLFLPFLLIVLDVFGQVACLQTTQFEDNELAQMQAYYYFNGITPTPTWHYTVMIILDVVFLVVLILPLFYRYFHIRKPLQMPDSYEPMLVVDHWDEVFEAEAAVAEKTQNVVEEHNSNEKIL